MKKIEANDTEAQSADIVADNLSQLQSLFPEAFAEGKVQFDVLRQLLGGAVDEADEKYGLNWHGKRRARQIALTPSTGTLRPCPDESVDWDNTKNLMIEGDNLEVLKLLQKSYAGKVKLMFIDPPYNTGNDFVYPDNFRDSLGNYLEITGQVENRAKLSSNTDSSGRFHTDWLSMIYPRLRLSRSLLANDGAIFVSIDDNEASRLRSILDEVFGEENFLANVIWNHTKQSKNDERYFSRHHNQIFVYRKSEQLSQFRFDRSEKDNANYSNPDKDPKGDWRAGDVRSPSPRETLKYPILTPSGKSIPPPDNGWRWSEESTKEKIASGEIFFSVDETRIIRKIYLSNQDGRTPENIWLAEFAGTTRQANAEIKELFGESVFDTPKPTQLLSKVISLCSEKDGDIVLDFFAGLGATGHAVWEQGLADNINRRFVLIQLPEPLDSANKEQKVAADFCKKIDKPSNISELTKERLRRAAKKIQKANPKVSGDFGFRVFKLDESNIQGWNPDRENLAQTLLEHHEHILDGRTEADITYELLLKLGLDLCVPMETRIVAGKSVEAVGGGVLMLCLADKISAKEVEAVAAGIVAWHKELAPAGDSTVVFRDSAFDSDVAKTNMAAILAQNGLENVRSL